MKKILITIVTLLFASLTIAQIQDSSSTKSPKTFKPQVIKPLKIALNDDGSHFIQFTGLLQAWVRYNESNPNSTVNRQTSGADHTFDVGLRRVRFQTMGQLTDRAYFYTQIGENSFSYLSERKFGLFLMDATGDYEFIKKYLTIGAGLGSWTGPLRYSAPAVASFLGMEGPIYQQTTNDLNDQFVRRMMVYAKGKIGKLDYRVSVAKPFIANSAANLNGTGQAGIGLLSTNGFQNDVATFSTRGANAQLNTYLTYEFLDSEIHKNPYNPGTYGGSKKVFNVGAGLQYQKDAMWYTHVNDANPAKIDTITHQYFTAGLDVFYDAPSSKGAAIGFYAAYLYSDYGRNYVRNLGVMNAADAGKGYSGSAGAFNSGGGSAFSMNGTGHTIFAQFGYKLKDDLLGEHGTLQPYLTTQLSAYQYFDYKVMSVFDVGINWLIKGQNSKISLDYQSRPYFEQTANEAPKETARRGMLVMQYQFAF